MRPISPKPTYYAWLYLVLLLPTTGYATNGMNMEGYGAKSTAMGGVGMAFDVGNSAVMSNPATLGLMPPNSNRLELGLRNLRPDVSTSAPHPSLGRITADSGGDSYLMPSVSYMRHQQRVVFGAAIFAQGGMGTEYEASSFLALGTGEDVRSELSVGRVMFPLAFRVNPQLTVAASFDVVWAGTDLKIAAAADQLQGMMSGGTLQPQFNGAIDAGMVQAARIDFSNDNDYTGEADAIGWGGKLGFTYRATPQFTIGAAYHFETKLDDIETDNARLAGYAAQPDGTLQRIEQMTLLGNITIKDFQWPAVFALGMAYQPNDRVTLAADFKRINWSDVLETYDMTFTAGSEYGGGTLDITMRQNWSDQNVLHLGGEYQVNTNLALRAGMNLSENPIPSEYLNPLFPATTRRHFMAGLGYDFNPQHSLNFVLIYAPSITATTPQGIENKHSQTNWAINYTYRF